MIERFDRSIARSVAPLLLAMTIVSACSPSLLRAEPPAEGYILPDTVRIAATKLNLRLRDMASSARMSSGEIARRIASSM